MYKTKADLCCHGFFTDFQEGNPLFFGLEKAPDFSAR
jgi:hypothetical protein